MALARDTAPMNIGRMVLGEDHEKQGISPMGKVVHGQNGGPKGILSNPAYLGPPVERLE